MILKLMDKTEMFVDEREGKAIRSALTKSAEGFITVRGTTIKKSVIAKLEEGGVDTNAELFANQKALAATTKPRCRAQYSIQSEINDIIKSDFPDDWAKRIQSKKFREAVRTKLRSQPGVLWCDSKANECACG